MVQARAKKLARVVVWGVVQGVGFRPFVYRLAHQHSLQGWVRNTSGNVEIEVEGNERNLRSFLVDLEAKAPPMAHIEQVEVTFLPARGNSGFEILTSQSEAGQYQLVSPDIATCEDCRRELLCPADRRYRYPFTNCTNCGPRFTIIEDIPYDRARTTMRQFKMCPRCQQEYDDPLNRRFHAQPNACPDCGPNLEIVDGDGCRVVADDVVRAAGKFLKQGKILAIRGLGGFQLACDATNRDAVDLLRTRKKRVAKPFAVMVATMEDVARHCLLSPGESRLLESPECPIVLLRWRHNSSDICPSVAPNLKYVGMMLPYTPLHHLLLNETGLPLVMTSGNLSEEPIAKDNGEALTRLKGIADYFLLHNRDIYSRYDDSVYFVDEIPRPIRRARGYAPYPIFLSFKSEQVLACGAEEKNTFCLTKDEHAFLSQHIGDMENEETLQHFENTIKLYKGLFRIEPRVIACDMHPEYLSTKYARQIGAEHGLSLVPVQHHHAHIASCLAENRVNRPVIGVALDGTGYGSDGTIWGGEFLLADLHSFRRMGHLEYVPLPGGAAAIKKPYRMALSYLYTLLGKDFPLAGLPLAVLDPGEVEVVSKQLERRVNSPFTSSAGRLFDAVSALVGVRGKIDYEAQAAIELEMAAPDNVEDFENESYPFAIVEEQGVRVVKLSGVISAVARDVRAGVPAPRISARFHHTVAQIITRMCRVIAEASSINEVALSGGVFQNRLLLKLATSALKRGGFSVLTHQLVPCNDGGVALGQAVIANFAVKEGLCV
ncbi:MAG: carbamoyltransferase HypF [Dehalococcoidales bacterium]|nr:carbamoyltransferase HypF [Dehalococcoidales bacterium]